MTTLINSITPRAQFVAVAGQASFPFPFWITVAEDLSVYVNSALKTLGVDYTVSGLLNTNGGDVEFTLPLVEGDIITLERNMPLEKTSEFQEAGAFKASVLNLELSKLVAMMQQLKRDIDRKVGLQPTSLVNNIGALTLPDPKDGKALVFDGTNGVLRTSVVNVDSIDTAILGAQNAAADATTAKVAA